MHFVSPAPLFIAGFVFKLLPVDDFCRTTGARNKNIFHTGDIAQAFLDDMRFRFGANDMDVWSGIHSVAGGDALGSPAAHFVHYFQ